MLSPEQQQKIIQSLLSKKENAHCADCNAKYPSWASLDFGAFVCMNCSGAHRALGPSITRVRSTKLDTWNRDWVQNMKVGNSILNQYWQNQLTGVGRAIKPNTETSLSDIIKYVQDKYVKKKYIDTTYALDPLKRSKLPQQQQQPKEQTSSVNFPTTKPAFKPNPSNKEISFENFTILPKQKQKPKEVKPAENLISFEMLQPAKVNNPTKSQQPHKYNHQTYHTASQVANKPSNNLIDFEQLSKLNHTYSNGSNASSINPPTHQNHFIAQPNFNSNPYATNNFSNQNPYHSSQHYNPNPHYNTHSMPQYDKAQYVIMNINMNMYPKVMNINMGPYATTSQSNNNTNFDSGWLNNGGQKPKDQGVKINMQSNINMDGKGGRQASKSWVDDWK